MDRGIRKDLNCEGTHLAGEVSGELPDDVAGEDGDHALVPGHEQRGVQLGRAAQQGLVHKHWSAGGLLQGLHYDSAHHRQTQGWLQGYSETGNRGPT